MSADLMRQLDSYGDQLEQSIDHVTAEELTTADAATTPDTARPKRRTWISYRLGAGLGLTAFVLIVAVAGFQFLGGAEFDSPSNFDSISAELGGETNGDSEPLASSLRGRTTEAPAATAAPTTSPPRTVTTTAAPSIATTTTPPRAATTTLAPPTQTTPPSLQGRDVVFTGTMVVAVPDSAASADEVRRIAESFGGFVARSSTTSRVDGQSTLTVRVLPSTFQTILDRIGDLGTVRSEQVTSDDVTDVVVDLESQITTAEVSVERLRTLLEDASGLDAITRLERELLERERDLERLRGQLRTVENQVGLATISVTLTESFGNPAIDLRVSRYIGDDSGALCPAAGGRPSIGDEISVCIVVTNSGDVPLVDVVVGGDGVAALGTGLSVTSGDPDRLDPGETISLTGTVVASNPVTAQFEVTGTPLNDDGEPVTERSVAQERRISWNPRPAPEPPEPDTLVTAFQDGWSAFTDIGGRTLRVLAYVAPFLVTIAALGWLVWWQRRRYWARLDQTMGTPADLPRAGPDSPGD